MESSVGANINSGTTQTTDGLAPKAGNSTTEVKTPLHPQKYRVSVDGQESELPIEDILRDYQTSKASTKRFQEASKLRAEADQVLKALQAGDLAFVKSKVPKDVFKKLSTDFLLEELEWENLPETERRRITAERKAAELEEKLTARERQEKAQADKIESERHLEQAQKALDTELGSAISELKSKGHALDHGHLYRATQLMEASILTRQEIMPAKRALEIALAEDSAVYDSRLKSVDAEELMQRLTPAQQKALQQHFVKKASVIKSQPSSSGQRPARAEAPKKSINEWFEAKHEQLRKK